MSTTIGTIISRARTRIAAPKVATAGVAADRFYEDAELLDHANDGARDLWRAFVDLHEGHFVRIVDSTTATVISLAASSPSLTGIPTDLFRIVTLEPSNITSSGTTGQVVFTPARYNSTEYKLARAQTALDPTSGGEIFYTIINAGSPVETPSVIVAPQSSSAITLRCEYVYSLPRLELDSLNPIPGESDNALTAWIVAYALGKSMPDGSFVPDQTWLAIYGTEKGSALTVSAPRQEQAPEVRRGYFDDAFGGGLSGDGSDFWS